MPFLLGPVFLNISRWRRLIDLRYFRVRRTRNRSGGRSLRIQKRLNISALRSFKRNLLSVKFITYRRVPERRWMHGRDYYIYS